MTKAEKALADKIAAGQRQGEVAILMAAAGIIERKGYEVIAGYVRDIVKEL